jgi:TRAP-type mannitol/chloroaromatic compound transport system permease small subunit
MLVTTKRLIIAIAVGLYLYFLLPATAVLFYELYHLTGIGPVYWGYSAFKAGGYYFGIWQYQLLTCVLVSAAIVIIPGLIQKVRSK